LVVIKKMDAYLWGAVSRIERIVETGLGALT
jgi:hypothetical protein